MDSAAPPPAGLAHTVPPNTTNQPTPPRARSTIERTVSAIGEFYAHLGLVGSMLVGMWLLEKLVFVLWPNGKLFHFGSGFSAEQVFDTSDLTLIVGAAIIGLWETLKRYAR